jgi:multidrug efflux pump subunit AcrA (membrane-fusion protein)
MKVKDINIGRRTNREKKIIKLPNFQVNKLLVIIKFSNRQISTLFLILLALSFQSCQQTTQIASKQSKKKSPLVKVKPAIKKEIKSFVEITGTVEANISSEIKSPADGSIEKLFARENQMVTKDKVIAIINPNDRVALIANNQLTILSLEEKIVAADKNSKIHSDLLVELEQAKSNLEYARKMYQTVPVICPMNGMVTHRWLDEGSLVVAKDVILTVSDMSSLVVKAEVNEKFFEAIKNGLTLPIVLNAYPTDTLKGKISMVYPQIEPSTRSVKFDIKILNFNKPLLQGMMALIKIPVNENPNAIVVEDDALLTNPDNKQFLFVVNKDSIAMKRVVRTGISADGVTEIITGLKENEWVVSMGQEALKDSVKVMIMNLKMK